MGRIRTIKPGFFLHERLADLPYEARLAFIGLWTLADGKGRLEYRPKWIKAQVFPYDAELDMAEVLGWLEHGLEGKPGTGGHIVTYEVDDRRFIAIPSFAEHQRVSGKEAQEESEIPPPPPPRKVKQPGSGGEAVIASRGSDGAQQALSGASDSSMISGEASGKQSGSNGEASIVQEGKGREGKGESEQRGSSASASLPLKLGSVGTEPPAMQASPIDLQALWNRAAVPAGLAKWSEMSKKRKALCGARLAERSLDEWRAVIERIAASAFCRGQNDRGWRATPDWLVANSENAAKVLEGKYDGKAGSFTAPTPVLRPPYHEPAPSSSLGVTETESQKEQAVSHEAHTALRELMDAATEELVVK